MESIIKKLYYGNMHPREGICVNSPTYRKTIEEVEAIKDLLKNKLSSEDVSAFEEMEELINEVIDLDTLEGFSYGLRLGVLFMYELLENSTHSLK